MPQKQAVPRVVVAFIPPSWCWLFSGTEGLAAYLHECRGADIPLAWVGLEIKTWKVLGLGAESFTYSKMPVLSEHLIMVPIYYSVLPGEFVSNHSSHTHRAKSYMMTRGNLLQFMVSACILATRGAFAGSFSGASSIPCIPSWQGCPFKLAAWQLFNAP